MTDHPLQNPPQDRLQLHASDARGVSPSMGFCVGLLCIICSCFSDEN